MIDTWTAFKDYIESLQLDHNDTTDFSAGRVEDYLSKHNESNMGLVMVFVEFPEVSIKDNQGSTSKHYTAGVSIHKICQPNNEDIHQVASDTEQIANDFIQRIYYDRKQTGATGRMFNISNGIGKLQFTSVKNVAGSANYVGWRFELTIGRSFKTCIDNSKWQSL